MIQVMDSSQSELTRRAKTLTAFLDPHGRMNTLLLSVNITETLVTTYKQSRWVMLYKFMMKDPESTGN